MKYPCFQLLSDHDRRWRWCLIDAHGRPNAWSSEPFNEVYDCIAAAYSLPGTADLPFYDCPVSETVRAALLAASDATIAA